MTSKNTKVLYKDLCNFVTLDIELINHKNPYFTFKIKQFSNNLNHFTEANICKATLVYFNLSLLAVLSSEYNLYLLPIASVKQQMTVKTWNVVPLKRRYVWKETKNWWNIAIEVEARVHWKTKANYPLSENQKSNPSDRTMEVK